ncbi:MAG: aldehyde dehydrogenase family protein [Candidatus Latescibacteria bacterium]|nr:aldehyde dehydrogenase family protein [bacterium]MBD3425397.1 aldehyde dehydrogenase family protein [Candidatus Latescibacterota bacterium]
MVICLISSVSGGAALSIKSINPANGEVIREYQETSGRDCALAVREADDAFAAWKKTESGHRAELMRRVAGILRSRAEDYGRLMALEMGKVLDEGVAEARKCALVCEYYAESGSDFLAPEEVETEARKSYVSFRPLGVILAVMPWNFPFWQVFRFAAPALMAGNGAVLKHASNVPGCALEIEKIFREAGFPENIFRTVLAGGSRVEEIIADPLVKAVTLTGSVPAGREVASAAGRYLKKTVMELGGSDPCIILEDADLEMAARACATSRLINSGQSCIAAKRFVVVEKVLDRFLELFTEIMRSVRIGDPLDKGVDIGPLAREDLRDELHNQVLRSLDRGAECILGGRIPGGPGAFYPATILTGVTEGMPAYQEELFGPVASIIPASDEKDAVRIANHTSFGLGAAVFTSDLEKGERIANEEIESGNCFVNEFVRSDPRLPFGGIKESGYGRELSYFGIREFVNIKTIYVR